MKPTDVLVLVPALLGIGGCPTRDKYDPTPTVRITSPSIDTYTNGTVRITAAIDPVLELPIVLLENGIALTTLTPPSYAYDWATSGVPEGTHNIVAEVAFSGGTVRSAPLTVVVDRTPPTVSSRTPAPGEKSAMLRTPIQVAFSEPIVLLQPAEAIFSVAIIGGSTVPVHVTLDSHGQTATIAIDELSALFLPTSFLGLIGPTIADRAGNPLTLPSNDWVWDVPDFVKLPQTPLCERLPGVMRSRLPTFAVGSNLKPVLAWAGGAVLADGVHCQLQVSKYDGAQWIQMAPVSDDVNSAVQGAALALSANDEVFLAARPPSVPDPGAIDVAGASGTTWQAFPPILPQAGVFFPVVYPVMRIGPDGSPVLLWGAGSSADRYFMARRAENGWTGDFGAIPVISQQPFDGPHFDMILDEDGDPIVGWVAPTDRGHVSRWNGTAWITAAERTEMSEPFLALDSARRPMVVTGRSGSFFVQSLADDDSWQLLPMAAAVPPQSRHARIAAGPDGLPVLAWFDAQTTGVGMARWLGQRWDTRAVFFSPSNAIDEAPQLIVDRQGTAWIGWRDSTGQFNVWMSNF